MRIKIILLFTICSGSLFSQKTDLSTLLISQTLKENANSVIRFQQIDITILSQKQLLINEKKTVTVYNKYGLNNIDAYEYYDKSTSIKSISAVVYNEFGEEIKKIKRKDFKDQSVADGFSILTDGRIVYLDFTPTEYPFTIVYESEVESSNTAFIPTWRPVDDYYESIEKSILNVNYVSDLGFKFKVYNFENKSIVKQEILNKVTFTAENIVADKPEELSPSYQKNAAYVLFGLEKFYLEGVEGSAKSWNDFGTWMYSNLLNDVDEIPIETQNKIKELVKNEIDPIAKAKKVYQYVQSKTRYVSIQLGIGGWKPMLAKDVDRLGYGDCKALSNYTRSLLKTIGVESYYTIIYGGQNKQNLQEDFVSMQGNHAILTIPNKDKYVFLECTSQIAPFGFEGDFTDDRLALIVKPTHSELVKTNEYVSDNNTQIINGNYTIDENGSINGNLNIKSRGIQYDNVFSIENKSKEEIEKHYNSHFSWINNLKMDNIKLNNNKENVEFTEEMHISAANYGDKNGQMMLFPLNAYNQNSIVPQRYRNRKKPLEISRGFNDVDEVEISIPIGFIIDAKPENFELNDKFGKYKTEIVIINPTKLLYKRSLLINKGLYDSTEYENYRKFKEQIAKNDNSKLILIKK